MYLFLCFFASVSVYIRHVEKCRRSNSIIALWKFTSRKYHCAIWRLFSNKSFSQSVFSWLWPDHCSFYDQPSAYNIVTYDWEVSALWCLQGIFFLLQVCLLLSSYKNSTRNNDNLEICNYQSSKQNFHVILTIDFVRWLTHLYMLCQPV